MAHDLTPSMTAGIVAENIAGILTEVGGRTSHSAILARAMEIPAVLSIDGICTAVKNGDRVVLNGTSGEAIVNPDAETEQKFAGLLEEYKKEKELLKKFAGVPTVSADGTKVELVCNIGKPEDAKKAVECDGEGIGLFRTEFLFMDRDTIPTEEEQFEAYKSVAETMKGKPVIIRTLDIGGDKEIPYLGLEKEDNPFLGYRAIRFCLQRTDIYNTQLRALVRASAFGRIKIMVPLVTCVDELRSVKAMVADIMKELDAEGIAYNKNLEIGIMMETPAACMMADVLAKEAAFFSIGTNDLTGYTMAVDRDNPNVSELFTEFHPAVLKLIKMTVDGAHKHGKHVCICGEFGGNTLATRLLMALGLDELSMNPNSMNRVKKILSLTNREEPEISYTYLTEELSDAEEIKETLKEDLIKKNLVRFGFVKVRDGISLRGKCDEKNICFNSSCNVSFFIISDCSGNCCSDRDECIVCCNGKRGGTCCASWWSSNPWNFATGDRQSEEKIVGNQLVDLRNLHEIPIL